MHVVFLGTGASEGIPALFCVCELCMQARRRGGRNVRSRSQQCIARRVLVDWPPDAFAHVQGFAALREGEPLHLWAEPHVLELFAGPDPHELAMVHHPTRAFEPIDLGDGLIATPIRAHHTPEERGTVNYLFADGRAVYLQANDTGWYDPPTWEFLASLERPREVGHLGVGTLLEMRQELIDIGAMAADARVFATHFGHNGGMLHESLEAAFAGTGVEAAYDGLAVEL